LLDLSSICNMMIKILEKMQTGQISNEEGRKELREMDKHIKANRAKFEDR
jgi:hypothetical protein